MKVLFKWEFIDSEAKGFTERAKVIGGWLIRTYDEDNGIAIAMCFVADENHEWEV